MSGESLTSYKIKKQTIVARSILGKTQVPHRIDETLDESLYRGGNSHLTSQFCKDELGHKFQHGTRACRIQGPPTYFTHQAQRVLGVRGVYWEKPKSHIG